MITLETKFEKLTYANGSFAIYRTVDGQSVKGDVLGIQPEQLLKTPITLIGDWEAGKGKFGPTFKFERYTVNEDQVIFFLTKVIGHMTASVAKAIKDKYGDDIWKVFDEKPEELLEIRGLKEKKLKRILASWKENKTLLKLAQVLSPHGVSNNQVSRIHEHFGEAALDIVLKEPYRIIDMRGVGFKLADEIAMKMGHSAQDPARIKACAEYVIMEITSQGHSATRPSTVIEQMQEALTGDHSIGSAAEIKTKCLHGLIQLINDDVAGFVLDSDLSTEDLVRQDALVSTAELIRRERFILECLKTKGESNPAVEDIEAWITQYEIDHVDELPKGFGEEQKEAIRLANHRYPIFSISGYAGTGKTTVSKAILSLITQDIDREDVVCVAFAGIAANRIKSKSGYNAGTIHATLGFTGESYMFNAEEKLPQRVVLLDEAGMPDSEMIYRLLSAIDLKRTTFVMMGDPAQLQPVGSGQPYADALANNLIPNVTMTEIHRTSPDMAINVIAQSVRNNQIPDVTSSYTDFGFNDVSIPNLAAKRNTLSKEQIAKLREENNHKIRDQIMDIANKAKKSVMSLVSPKTAWEFITRFQVIAPMRNGVVGVEELNMHLQQVFNPPAGQTEIKSGNRVYRTNDKIVHLKNKDMKAVNIGDFSTWLKNDDDALLKDKRVMNGQLGVVVDANEEELHVYYPMEKYVVTYTPQQLSSNLIQHSYALTVHKTQGSEYQQVVFPLTLSHYNMLTPELLYTAITRTKKRMDIIGEQDALRVACKSRPGQERVTIIDAVAKHEAAQNKPALRPV